MDPCLDTFPFPVVIGAIIIIGVVAVALTRLWTRQLGMRLEEIVELNNKLVPVRNALATLRDATSQASMVARELQTLQRLREEAASTIAELNALGDRIAVAYNNAVADVETHGTTLVNLCNNLKRAHAQLDEAYLRHLIWYTVYDREVGRLGTELLTYLNSNNYRVNTKLRDLIIEFFDQRHAQVLNGQSPLSEEVPNGHK